MYGWHVHVRQEICACGAFLEPDRFRVVPGWRPAAGLFPFIAAREFSNSSVEISDGDNFAATVDDTENRWLKFFQARMHSLRFLRYREGTTRQQCCESSMMLAC